MRASQATVLEEHDRYIVILIVLTDGRAFVVSSEKATSLASMVVCGGAPNGGMPPGFAVKEH